MDHEHKCFVLITNRPNCSFELSSNVTYSGFRVSRLPTVLNISIYVLIPCIEIVRGLKVVVQQREIVRNFVICSGWLHCTAIRRIKIGSPHPPPFCIFVTPTQGQRNIGGKVRRRNFNQFDCPAIVLVLYLQQRRISLDQEIFNDKR